MNLHKLSVMIMFFASACKQPTQETTPIRQDVIETVFASGVLEADNTYNLTAQNDGYLVAVNFEEGEVVKKGQILAIVENQENALNAETADVLYENALKNTRPDAPALRQARTVVENARQKMEQDRLQAERLQRLLETNSIAKNDYETAALNYETSKNNLQNAVEALKKLQEDTEQQTVSPRNQKLLNKLALDKNTIRAVERGKIYQKLKEKGDFVRRGDIIAQIGDPDFIYARILVDEGSISKIRAGQSALVQLNAQKARSYRAKVWQILPACNNRLYAN
jgi:HlyD family secretion protein